MITIESIVAQNLRSQVLEKFATIPNASTVVPLGPKLCTHLGTTKLAYP